MKKILVPTDFSDAARNAFVVALELARHTKSEVILCTAYDQPSGGMGVMIDLSERLKRNADDDLYNEVEEAKEAGYTDVNISQKCMQGDTAVVIEKLAALEKADLIVMGKTGQSGFGRKLMGSNTARTINDSKHNILVVPVGVNFSEMKKICFATDLKEHTEKGHSYQSCLKPVVTLGKLFKSQVHVLHITESQAALGELYEKHAPQKQQIEEALAEVDHKFVFTVDPKVIKALKDHFDKMEYDLVCMIKHEYPWVQKVFKSSPTVDVSVSIKSLLLVIH
jgi:nucleotide-binding universal stress UspA family protein